MRLAFAPLLLAAVALPAQQPTPKQPLSVLYAGVPDAPRTATWQKFLETHFERVGVVELAKLGTESASGYDVVVVDAPSPYGKAEGSFSMPKAPKLSRDWTKPTILVGAAGGAVLNGMRGALKLDWL
jgi:hypothetical protein